MGSVTATASNGVNDVFQTQSLHFESYEDFVNYENAATAAQPSQPENNIYLTDDEIYTLRVLLGHVVDKECNSIAEKLELLDPIDLDCEDYDKMYFTSYNNGKVHTYVDGEKEITIRFKEEE